MKNSIFSRMICVVLVLFYTGTMVPASTWKELGQSAKSTMDIYLDKAELSQSQSDWEMYVDTGFALACNVWENETGFEEEKSSIKEELNQSIQERYEKWLKKIINARVESNYSALKALLDKEEENYVLEGTDILADKEKLEQWKSHAEGIIEEYLKTLDLNLDDFEGEMRQSYADSSIKSLKKEMENLAELSYTRLLVKLNATIKKNAILDAEEAAKAVLQDVVAEATDKINAQMDSLFSSLETQLKNPTDTNFDSDSFLEQFKALYNQGLDSWAQAENEFLKDRTDWETSANDTYNEACTVWTAALEELQTRRTEWNTQITTKIKDLETQINTLKSDYSDEIQLVLSQYTDSLETQKQTYLDYSVALTENYYNLRNLLLTSIGSVKDWANMWSEKYNGIYSYWKTEDAGDFKDDIDTFIKNEETNYIKKIIDSIQNFDGANVKDDDIQKVIDAQNEILSAYLFKLKNIFTKNYNSYKKTLESWEQTINNVLDEYFNVYQVEKATFIFTKDKPLRENSQYKWFVEKYLDRLGIDNPDYTENSKNQYEKLLHLDIEQCLQSEDGLTFLEELIKDLYRFGYRGYTNYYTKEELEQIASEASSSDEDDEEEDNVDIEWEALLSFIDNAKETYSIFMPFYNNKDFCEKIDLLYEESCKKEDFTDLDVFIEQVKGSSILKNDKNFEITSGFIQAQKSLTGWFESIIQIKEKINDALQVIKNFPALVLQGTEGAQDSITVSELLPSAVDLQILQIQNTINILKEEEQIAQAVKDYDELPLDQRKTTEELEEAAKNAHDAYDSAHAEWLLLKEGSTDEKGNKTSGLEYLKGQIQQTSQAVNNAEQKLAAAKAELENATLAYKSELAKTKLNYQEVFLTKVKNELIDFNAKLTEALASATSELNYWKDRSDEANQETAKKENLSYLAALVSTKNNIDSLETALNSDNPQIDGELFNDGLIALYKENIQKIIDAKASVSKSEDENYKKEAQSVINKTVQKLLKSMRALYETKVNAANENSEPKYETARSFMFYQDFDPEYDDEDDYDMITNTELYTNETFNNLLSNFNLICSSVNSIYSNNKKSYKNDGASHSIKSLCSSYDKYRSDFGEKLKSVDLVLEVENDFDTALQNFLTGINELKNTEEYLRLNSEQKQTLECYFISLLDMASYNYVKNNRKVLENDTGTIKENPEDETSQDLTVDAWSIREKIEHLTKNTETSDYVLSFYTMVLSHYYRNELLWNDALVALDFETTVNMVLTDDSKKSEYRASYQENIKDIEKRINDYYSAKVESLYKFFTLSEKEYKKIESTGLGSSEDIEQKENNLFSAAVTLAQSVDALDSYNVKKTEERLGLIKKELEQKEKACLKAVYDLEQVKAEYKSSTDTYNDFVKDLNLKMNEMEELRKAVRIADAIKNWAQSVYLHDENDENFVSPSQTLQNLQKEIAVYEAYLEGVEEAGKNSTYVFDDKKLESIKTLDAELKVFLDEYDELNAKYQDETQQIQLASYELMTAASSFVSENWEKEITQKDEDGNGVTKTLTQRDALDWISSFYRDTDDKGNQTVPYFSKDFEELLIATLYYITKNGSEEQKALIDYFDPEVNANYSLNGAPDKKEDVDCAKRYKEARLAYLEEIYNLYINSHTDYLEQINGCINYYEAQSLGNFIKTFTVYYLKQGAFSKLKSSLKKTESNHTYLSSFLFGVFKFKDDTGKAAAMYRGVVEGLENGNTALLSRQENEVLSLLGIYVNTEKKLSELTEQAKANDYLTKLERYVRVETVEDDEGKVTELLKGLIPEKQADIESKKNAILTELAESVRNTQTQSAQSIASVLEEYKEKPLTQSDIVKIKSAAKTEWEKAADQRVYLQKSLDYYAKLIQTVANGANLNTFTESALIEFMHSYLFSFCDILGYQNYCEKAQYQSELEHSRLVYEKELDTILAQTKEIAVSGNREWNKAVAELEKKYTEFQNTFITRYNMQTAQWQNALDGFESDKADWIDQMFSEAAARSIVSLTEGGAVKASTASLEEARQKVRTLEKFSKDDFDAGQMVDTILNQTKIAQVNTLLNKRAESIEDVTKPAYALKGSTDYSLLELSERVQKIFDETTTIAENVSSRAASQQFAIEAEARRKETFAKIEAKNRETERGFDDRAYNEGYKKSNGAYTKTITKDVSVFSTQTEKVKVRLWKDFEADEPELNLSILYEQIDSNEFSVIMTLVSAQLTDWENSIFGVSGIASTGDDKASTKSVSYIVGEFEKYAYGEQYKGEVELGKGLVGAILLDFEKNSQKEKAGWEALDAPTWERKLWCSDTFPGPSIREFSTMVASIAATVCTFGAGAMLAVAVSAAVMAANELTFELADVGVGYHDWDEAAKNVAKAAVSGAISGASGAAMGAVSKVGGIGGVFLKTGITSSSSITTQFTNAFIDGGFSGVKDAFNSWSDWQGIAFSTAGSFVTNGVGYGLSNTNFTGFNSLQMGQINSIAGTVGGLTTNALEYAFTGQTSFNLLNLSMFGLEYGSMWGAQGTSTLSGGLFSMTLGKDGAHFAISSAGTDISLGTLYSNAMGIGHIVENSKIENYTQTNGQENLATSLRLQYGYGDSESKTLLDEILSGKTSLAVSSEKKDGATAKTTTDANGNKTVTLYGITADMSVEDMFKAGLVLQHEAHRDGVDNGEVGQLKETVEAVLAHSNMAAQILDDKLYAGALLSLISQDSNLKKDMDAFVALAKSGGDTSGIVEYLTYVDKNYDSSADYWRLTAGGQLISDGDGWLKDMNGNYILDENGNKIGAEKQESGLLNILAGTGGQKYDSFTDEQKLAVQKIMKEAGMSMDKNGQWYTALGKKIDMNKVMEIAGNTIAEAVFNQYYNNKVDSDLATAWNLDLAFGENTANKTVPELARERYSELISTHLLETDSPAALMDKYTWTIYDSNGVATQLYKIDENNPFLDDLLGQHDFKGLKSEIDSSGCNFMTILAYSQLLTGNIFTKSDIMAIYDNAIKKNALSSTGCWVKDRNTISTIGLNKLGISNFSLTFDDTNYTGYQHQQIGNRITWLYSNGKPYHYSAGTVYNNNIYNPGYTTKPDYSTTSVNLWWK